MPATKPDMTVSKSDTPTDLPLSSDSHHRPQWESKGQSIFACLALTLGIGNVVRFPLLAYQNGGGAFILLYVLFLILVGAPLYMLELSVGQYSQLGPINVWKCVSCMQGMGIAMGLLSIVTAIYYSQIMAYCVHYFFASFIYIGHPLPWDKCDHELSTSHCYEIMGGSSTLTNAAREVLLGNTTVIAAAAATAPTEGDTTALKQSAAQQYFITQVLGEPVFGGKTDDLGFLRWDLILCLMLCWMVVFLVLIKGVRSTGKAAYVTTTLPVILLIIIMIYGVMMKGAYKGLLYLFVPRWSALGDMRVWKAALEQVLFSLSVGYGGVIAYGSYNKFTNRVHLDTFAICFADLSVSIISSVAVFSVLGAMTHTLGLDDLNQLPDLGHSLAFVAYPSAISGSLRAPHLWSILFFFSLFILGVGTLAGHMHVLVAGLQDCMPRLRSSCWLISAIICCSCFLLGLPLCAEQRGHFLVGILIRYGISITVTVLALCELVTLSIMYGTRRFADDLSFMLKNYAPSMFWKLCWTFLSPVSIAVFIVYSAVMWSDPELYPETDPSWSFALRLSLPLVILGFIPLVFMLVFFSKCCKKNLKELFAPTKCWGPGDSHARSRLVTGDALANGRDNPGYDS